MQNTQIIGIDEVQFFDDPLIDFILENMDQYQIIATGLPFSFRGESFPFRRTENMEEDSDRTVKDLLIYATKTITKHPGCKYKEDGDTCGRKAIYPQRSRPDGTPSRYEDKTIVIGGSETYSPRCSTHFVKPQPST